MVWFKSLTLKLIVSTALIITITVGALMGLMLKTYQDDLTDQAIANANEVSEVIKRSTYLDMLSGQQQNVYRIMETIARKNSRILKLRIFNKYGRIKFSTVPAEKGLLVDKKAEACYQCHQRNKPLVKLDIPRRSRLFSLKDGTPVLGMITPIYNSKKCASCHGDPRKKKTLGVIDVDMSMAQISSRIRSGREKVIIFTGIIIIFLALAILFFMHTSVLNPIRETVGAMRRVSEGELDVRLPETRHDEIGYLVHAFNRMTGKLRGANERIRELIDGLEEKVEQRTREIQELQWNLVESEKLASLGRLSAGIAHELNNPLGSILIYAGLVEEDLPDGVTRENVQKIIQETIRSRDIVRGLLEFARPKELEITRVDLNEVVTRTVSLLEGNKAFMEKVRLVKHLADHPLMVMADPGKVQQVLTNLIINAVEACEDCGEVVITSGISVDGKFARISVIDNGVGISKENLSKIFEPFFTSKSGKGGTGLGLAVSYSIVKRHGGRIDVESKEGEGSTFTVKLPLTKDG